MVLILNFHLYPSSKRIFPRWVISVNLNLKKKQTERLQLWSWRTSITIYSSQLSKQISKITFPNKPRIGKFQQRSSLEKVALILNHYFLRKQKLWVTKISYLQIESKWALFRKWPSTRLHLTKFKTRFSPQIYLDLNSPQKRKKESLKRIYCTLM